MKEEAHDRKNKRKHGNTTWKPRVHNKVLVRRKPSSDAIAGVTGMFGRTYEVPYIISKFTPPATVEVCEKMERLKDNLT